MSDLVVTHLEILGHTVWKPIATAPENERLLFYFPSNNSVEIGEWWQTVGGPVYWLGSEDQQRADKPSHWMALPCAPA